MKSGFGLAWLCAPLLLVGCAAPHVTSQGAPPATAPTAFAADLDGLLAQNSYAQLYRRFAETQDAGELSQGLDWAKAGMMAGKGVIFPMLYSVGLYRASVSTTGSGSAEFRGTSIMSALLTLSIIQVDSVKCADKSSPGHRMAATIQTLRPIIALASSTPLNELQSYVGIAGGLELSTAPKRGEDFFLCGFGTEGFANSVPTGQVLDQPGVVGRQVVVRPDPNWRPRYTAKETWEPQMAAARAKLPELLVAVVKAGKK